MNDKHISSHLNDSSKYMPEKAMAPHSSTLAWKISWMEEPGRLQSMGSLRVRHDWSNLAATAAAVNICKGTIYSVCRYIWCTHGFFSVQFSLSHVRLFATPWIAAFRASLSITNSQSSLTHVHRVSDAIQPSHPLSSPSPLAPTPSQHQSLFQWVNSSHEVAKVLEFQL